MTDQRSTPARALLVVDVQVDFVEGGSLGVPGGQAVAEAVTAFARRTGDRYAAVVGSRDLHDPGSDNGGHFAAPGTAPDFQATWPAHCVAGTAGAYYAPGLDRSVLTHHLLKGQGRPAYSMFEGVAEDGSTLADLLAAAGVGAVDVAGIATDYCVRSTVLDALRAGLVTTVVVDLVAGVAPESSGLALRGMVHAGATLASSEEIAG